MKTYRSVVAVLFVLAAASGIAALAKGKPGGNKCPNCPSTIEVGGITCTLEACGFDCVYSCPFPA